MEYRIVFHKFNNSNAITKLNKELIRKNILEQRQMLSEEHKCALLQSVIDQLNLFDFSKIKVVHIYLPIKKKNELDTFPVIRFLKLISPNITIVIPKSNFKTFEMQNIICDNNTILSENNYGIMEPVSGIEVPYNEIDMVICPLLTFDKNGYRVGYGKGFYDRFLSKCRPDVIKIGLSYFEPIDEIEDIDTHDVKLSYAISPSKLWKFN